jgi:hypothetical protein
VLGGSHHEGNIPSGYQTLHFLSGSQIFIFQRTGTGDSFKTQRTSMCYDGFDSKSPYYYYFPKFEFGEILSKFFSIFFRNFCL